MAKVKLLDILDLIILFLTVFKSAKENKILDSTPSDGDA